MLSIINIVITLAHTKTKSTGLKANKVTKGNAIKSFLYLKLKTSYNSTNKSTEQSDICVSNLLKMIQKNN